jgi:sarcosine oxidase subunit beta
VGEVVRDLVLGNDPFVDPAPLSAARFALSALRPEQNVI